MLVKEESVFVDGLLKLVKEVLVLLFFVEVIMSTLHELDVLAQLGNNCLLSFSERSRISNLRKEFGNLFLMSFDSVPGIFSSLYFLIELDFE